MHQKVLRLLYQAGRDNAANYRIEQAMVCCRERGSSVTALTLDHFPVPHLIQVNVCTALSVKLETAYGPPFRF